MNINTGEVYRGEPKTPADIPITEGEAKKAETRQPDERFEMLVSERFEYWYSTLNAKWDKLSKLRAELAFKAAYSQALNKPTGESQKEQQ